MIERIIVGALHTNCYFFSFNKKDCLIIDPGGDADKIIASMEVLNMIPIGIVFTHGHFDHTVAASAIKDHFLGKSRRMKLAIHSADRTYLGRAAERNNRKHFSILGDDAEKEFEALFIPIPEPDILLKEGDDVFKSGLKVIETPGHTQGSICLYSKNENILFSGDTLFFESIGRTDLPGGNERAIQKSLRERILCLPPETQIYPGHGPLTTLERELKGNRFIHGIA
ncbi:MAG: MBL fold metallo-hydrolase [Spirochaetaceae bacterium]|nr:MAG: MBL fold metallo-hydrolase [Spirochaetaceae bacterium]